MLSTILAVFGLLWILERVKPLLSSILLSRPWNSQEQASDEKDTFEARDMDTMSNQQKSALFALIIGISEYKSPKIPNLSSATRDADSMKEYLENSLAVPSNNIHFLTNEHATRVAIKQALHDLTTDTRIDKEDPILIYYAGHGATTDAPDGWCTTGPKIQLIVPYDCDTKLDGVDIHGIPDRTFGALLRELAKEKGKNITVIFDCCHSGSGTRVNPFGETVEESVVIPESPVKPRGIKYNLRVPEDLDQSDWDRKGNRTLTIPSGFSYNGLASHVHLAACSETEKAWETDKGGEFTLALLETLNILGKMGISQISHKDLVLQIDKLPYQEPRCEGKHRDRIFLNRTTPIPEAVKYKVTKEKNEYILHVGEAAGFTEGSTFAVYNKSPSYEIGTLIASKPDSFSTTMRLLPGHYPFDIDGEAVAVRIGAGEEEALRLFIASDADFRFQDLMQEVSKTLNDVDGSLRKVVFNERTLADLEAKVERGFVVFDTLFRPATKYGVERLQIAVHPKVDDVKPIIAAAAHYYWHLRRVLAVQKESLDCVEFKNLEEVTQHYMGDDVDVLVPCGDNLIKDGKVELELKEDEQYGMKITNNAKESVYMWVFFFDHGDFTISPLHSPATSSRNGATGAPISPGECLLIGHGDGGVEPISFEMSGSHSLDVGFVVVIISTVPMDLSDMEQRDPKRALAARRKQKAQETAKYWHTLVIPIVQQKSIA